MIRAIRREPEAGLAAESAPVGEAELRAEAEAFATYVVDGPPSAELVGRYVDASRRRFPEPATDREEAALRFALGHRWSLGYLDAASGWLRPRSRLRDKLLLMAAILEASPDFVDQFMPRVASWPVLAWQIGTGGLAAVVKIGVGAVLLALAERTRS